MKRPLLILLFILLGTANVRAEDSPVWWSVVIADTKLPIERMQKTLATAYKIITEKSIKPLTASSLAYESVKSLSTIDQKIGVHKDGSRVLISADGKILKSFSAPENDDYENWSRLALAALIEARPFSPKAQQANEEDVLNIFINAALAPIDPYSHYEMQDPTELDKLKEPASIGIKYRRTGKYLEITEIVPDSPASQSELAVGDRIAKIGNKLIPDMSRVQILNALRGEKETEVTLSIRRDGKMRTVCLMRMPVKSSPVSYHFDQDNHVFTIKIAAFTPKTLKALKSTLDYARRHKAKGLIIDLRGNTGGLLKEAVLAADMFLPENFPLIKTHGRNHDAVQNYTTTEKNYRPVYPIAILIDAKTASSAEFFAGTLQDYRHAVLIGTPTFGKGVIQTVETLPNKGEIFLTWAQFELPTQYSPEKFGLYPNICTSGKTFTEIDTVPAPLTSLKTWRTGSEKDKIAMKSRCRPESRMGNDLDDELAAQLVLDPKLYERSLTYFSLDTFLK